jgi:hypothetical protein
MRLSLSPRRVDPPFALRLTAALHPDCHETIIRIMIMDISAEMQYPDAAEPADFDLPA